MKYLVICISLICMLAACSEQGNQTYSEQGGNGAPGFMERETAMLKDITKKDPQNADAFIRLGNNLMDAKNFREAVEAYGSALKLRPDNVDVRVDMGTCYRGLNNPTRAIEEYRKALKINPNHLNAHRNLGVVLAFDLHRNAEAIREFRTFLKLSPDGPVAKQVAGLIEELKHR